MTRTRQHNQRAVVTLEELPQPAQELTRAEAAAVKGGLIHEAVHAEDDGTKVTLTLIESLCIYVNGQMLGCIMK